MKKSKNNFLKKYWWLLVLVLVILVFLYSYSGSSVNDLGEVLVVTQ